MTKKEQLKVDALIAQNIGYREEIRKHMSVYGCLLSEVVMLRARIETMREVMSWPIGDD